MKYYIIAGEASGDLHGSNLIRQIKLLDPLADILCWGGDKMESSGAKLIKHYRDLAFMGFVEVIKNLPTILRNLSFCKSHILQNNPDVLILIDYPGFNLRIAEWANKKGIKVVFYISPQVWAWKENRVKIIKKAVDKMLVILPFEKEFYKKWNLDVDYVGHPLVEVIESFEQTGEKLPYNISNGRKIVALLPGSRKQEILAKLPIMLEVSLYFPAYQFVVAKAPGIEEDFYNELLAPYKNVTSVLNQTYPLLASSTAALVTSGTATLETALFGVPEVICYKGSKISYLIAKQLIKIKYIGLVNLIMDKEVVKELIQDDLTVKNLKKELMDLLDDKDKRERVAGDYKMLKDLLKKGGDASAKAAEILVSFLKTGR